MQRAKRPQEFVLRNTRRNHAPLVPEIALHLADEVVPLWQMTEAELEESGVAPPYWAFAWAGGQALARYILDESSLVHGRTVLDFAAGCGIAGIAAARAGALSVLCADIDPFADAACRINGALNTVSIHTTTDDLIGLDLVPDIVLAGDICYEQPLAARVITWLADLSAQGARVLIGDPGRSYLPKSGLDRLTGYAVQTSRDLEDQDVRHTEVYRLCA
jgi:predicted nicotinamide N-methyase